MGDSLYFPAKESTAETKIQLSLVLLRLESDLIVSLYVANPPVGVGLMRTQSVLGYQLSIKLIMIFVNWLNDSMFEEIASVFLTQIRWL